MSKMVFNDPRLATLNGFGVELNVAEQRADLILNGRRSTSSKWRSATSSAWCSRLSMRTSACG